jgi:hypothetical protein
MVDIRGLAAHLAPDTVRRLERAAEERFDEGDSLKRQNHLLGALYLYGYSVEMCLAAAYFRSAGFRPDQPIEDVARRQRMAKARQELHSDGRALMSGDPHPLDGWARFLEWNRRSSIPPASQEAERLRVAVRKAQQVYKHWRPELRYKTIDVAPSQLDEVRQCVRWFIVQRGRL